ncbi:MAG: PhoH family protein [Pseudomonadota bacterium]
MSSRHLSRKAKTRTPGLIEIDNHRLLPLLLGEHDQNLLRIEQQLSVTLACRGNHIKLSGEPWAVLAAQKALEALYKRLEKGLEVTDGEVDAAVRMARADGDGGQVKALHSGELAIPTRKGSLTPRSPGQAAYVRALLDHQLVFAVGPAGTGKTYLAVAMAVSWLISGKVERIILSRPAVEAGERLGFLPGDMLDKVDPYLRPLYDALYDMLPGDQVAARISNGEIEVAPLAFMRGRTLSNAFIILDEAQNTTPGQMKMFLTRLGQNSRMVINGDLTQIDLPKGQPSGLRDAASVLKGMEEVGFVHFSAADVVRHSLVTKIVQAYDARDGDVPQEDQGDS